MRVVSNIRETSVVGWKNAGHFLPGLQTGWENAMAFSFLKTGADLRSLRRACKAIRSQAKEQLGTAMGPGADFCSSAPRTYRRDSWGCRQFHKYARV